MSDTFAGAQWLTGTSISGNNSTATGEAGEPNRDYHSVWFKWTATASSEPYPTFDTNGSDFDTYLYIYTGTNLDNLNLIASNDDGGEGNNSEITLDIGSAYGITYYIKLTGYSEEDFGNYVLNYPLAGTLDPRTPIISVIEEPPYPITIGADYNLYAPLGTTQSYIEVWRSFGGPAPWDLTVPNAIADAKDYVLRGGTPNNNFEFQWWSKRPPGNESWNGGPGSIDPPNGTLLIESSPFSRVVGQSGTHSVSNAFVGGFNAEIKYGISTYAMEFYMGAYLYVSPNSSSYENYWEDLWGYSTWNPGQPTPPEHYERQVPATIPAKLLGATLSVGGEVYGTAPTVNIYVGDQLGGKYQNNYYGDLITGSPLYTGTISTDYINNTTEIDLTADFILNNMDSLGNIAFTFIDSDTLAGNFTCVPGTPVLGGVQSLTVTKRQVIYANLYLHFMSPTYNHFTFRYGTPPLRLAQRDDQEGLSPTARLDLSPSNSLQKNNSSRIFGGLYL